MPATTYPNGQMLGTVAGLGRLTVLAAAFAMAVNAGVFLVGALSGVFPLALAPSDGPMTLGPVLFVSAMAAIGGMGTFALLRTRWSVPFGTFVAIAVVVLLLSFALPFLIPGWSLMEILMLNIMHTVAAGIVVGAAWVASHS